MNARSLYDASPDASSAAVFAAPVLWTECFESFCYGVPACQSGPSRKPSGLPFHCRLTDIAHQAGLTEPSISGHLIKADYVIEAMGCGVAFFDFDNDGWHDILVLSGSRFGDPPAERFNRLYRNNRDGTFTDITKKAGLFHTGYALA